MDTVEQLMLNLLSYDLQELLNCALAGILGVFTMVEMLELLAAHKLDSFNEAVVVRGVWYF